LRRETVWVMIATGETNMASEDNAEDEAQAEQQEHNKKAYWSANIKLLSILMAIWFIISFGAGIIFRPFLDQ
jgi:hypothetical protein